MATNLVFRRASARDLDRLVEIHLAAYPDPRSVEARRRNFTRNPFGELDDLVVAEEGGRVVGHAFLFPFRAWFGGNRVRLGGIASVGVAPEARGRGVATALMGHVHECSRRRGDALTMLHAFRHGFYGRMGYALTSSRKRLAIDTRAVPASWRELGRAWVRGLGAADRRRLRRVYEHAAELATGWIARPERFWNMLFLREERVMLVCDRAPERASRPKARAVTRTRSRAGRSLAGYVAFSLVQEHLHAETICAVEELVALDDEARRALLGALAAMRDQATEMVIEASVTDPLEQALIDVDGRRFGSAAVAHPLGEIVGGPMVRIGDVPRALEARGYVDDARFELVVSDEVPGGGARVHSVEIRGGRAAVASSARRSASRALQTTRAGLSAIFYGSLRVRDAVALGLADADARTIAAIDAAASMPAFSSLDAF